MDEIMIGFNRKRGIMIVSIRQRDRGRLLSVTMGRMEANKCRMDVQLLRIKHRVVLRNGLNLLRGGTG